MNSTLIYFKLTADVSVGRQEPPASTSSTWEKDALMSHYWLYIQGDTIIYQMNSRLIYFKLTVDVCVWRQEPPASTSSTCEKDAPMIYYWLYIQDDTIIYSYQMNSTLIYFKLTVDVCVGRQEPPASTSSTCEKDAPMSQYWLYIQGDTIIYSYQTNSTLIYFNFTVDVCVGRQEPPASTSSIWEKDAPMSHYWLYIQGDTIIYQMNSTLIYFKLTADVCVGRQEPPASTSSIWEKDAPMSHYWLYIQGDTIIYQMNSTLIYFKLTADVGVGRQEPPASTSSTWEKERRTDESILIIYSRWYNNI